MATSVSNSRSEREGIASSASSRGWGGGSDRSDSSSRNRSGRAVDSTTGGWAEEEDRVRRESSRHDGGESYNRTWNERVSGGGYGESSRSGSFGNSVISQSVNSHYSKSNKSLSPVGDVQENAKTLTGGIFGKSYSNNQYSPREDWDNVSFFTSEQRLRDIADHDEAVSRQNIHDGNAVGRAVSNVVSSVAPFESVKGAIGTMAGGAIISKGGTIRDKLNGRNPALEHLTPQQRNIYESRRRDARNAFDESMDSLGSRAKSGAATAVTAFTNAIPGVGQMLSPVVGLASSTIANNSRYNSAMEHVANKLDSPAFRDVINKRNEAMRRSWKERVEMKTLNGNSEPIQNGILGTMNQRLNTTKTDENDKTYGIPQLFNYWNNITIE